MQIIINQAEIEQAISQFVLGQMSIHENMEMKIDLRATRGDSGYTAEIIVIAREEASVEPESPLDLTGKIAAARKPRAAKAAAPAAAAETAAEIVQETTQEAPEKPAAAPARVSPQDVLNAPDEEDTDNAADTEAVDPAPAEEAASEPAAEERPTNSIFGGLKKPVNTPTS